MTILEEPRQQRVVSDLNMDAQDSESQQAPGMIHRRVTDDQICVLTFDRPDSQANLFDRATLEELNFHLNFITSHSSLQGLVLYSAKRSIFIAGADIHSLAGQVSKEEVSNLIQLGQGVFNRIAALKIPTIAAIHGACVGGGFEICLACDYRLASPARATKIGLPETQLGILPAWGGATRLPRLIGVPAALDIILGGKTLSAKRACQRGLVDELVPAEYLLETALLRIRKPKGDLRRRSLPFRLRVANQRWVTAIIRNRVERVLRKKTRGHYPAVLKALDVVTKGITGSIESSLLREREALAELAQTEACHNLIRLFFLQERAKKLGGKNQAEAIPVRRLAVIGAGVMGAGITQWVSAKQFPVILRDINAEQVGKGMASVSHLYEQGLKRHVFSPLEARTGQDHLYPAATEVPLKQVDLVIEAAVERMDVKKDIFSRLDALTNSRTILATNTSALSISEIASQTRHPERVLGLHFFNPVHRMQLVEVVVGRQTTPDVVQRALGFVQRIGKLPVIVKDCPGFLVNRILMPYLAEAGRLFEHGASVRDIDEAMLDFGMPMGPLRLIDEVGVDVAHHVAQTLATGFPGRFVAPEILGRMMEGKMMGRKSGSGFYVHPKRKSDPLPNALLRRWQLDHGFAGLKHDALRTRMVLLMVNEAARCLEEGVVERPEDVDFGMVMGTGFAPFLGGPLRFADFAGIEKIVEELRRLAEQEPHFVPCELLMSTSAQRKTFYQEKGR
jgi:3-hydroxyacyl-CoA dehydrogenase / enoyl-CoA hydratase / 3-hydroxybutyryl-CoA epimerase